MIIPNVMPDEWSRSFLWRICTLNGTSSPHTLRPGFSRLYSGPTGPKEEKNWNELLAEAAGMPVSSFFAQHTVFPFIRTVRPVNECIPYGGVGDHSENGAYLRCGARRDYMFLCPECTTEDMSFWGFSYWRRSHQLFGSVYCQKHEVGLHEVHRSSWNIPPQDLLRCATPHEADTTFAALSDPVIRRYVEISTSLTERTQPVSIEWMVHLLRSRLPREKAERGRSMGRLNELAKELVPAPWLQKFFPGLDVAGGDDNSLDRTLCSVGRALSTPYYTLALALLFDNADEAITEVNRPTIESCDRPAALPLTTKAAASPRDKRLLAAVHAFVGGASVLEAAEAHRINVSDLEALLRSSTAQFTALTSKRKANHRHSSKIVT